MHALSVTMASQGKSGATAASLICMHQRWFACALKEL